MYPAIGILTIKIRWCDVTLNYYMHIIEINLTKGRQGSTVIRFSWGSHWLDIWRTFQRIIITPFPTTKKHLWQLSNYSYYRCQQLYVVKRRPQVELCALLAIRILIANSCTRWRWIFKGLSQNGGRANFQKISSPHPLMTTIRLNRFQPVPSPWTVTLITF